MLVTVSQAFGVVNETLYIQIIYFIYKSTARFNRKQAQDER